MNVGPEVPVDLKQSVCYGSSYDQALQCVEEQQGRYKHPSGHYFWKVYPVQLAQSTHEYESAEIILNSGCRWVTFI